MCGIQWVSVLIQVVGRVCGCNGLCLWRKLRNCGLLEFFEKCCGIELMKGFSRWQLSFDQFQVCGCISGVRRIVLFSLGCLLLCSRQFSRIVFLVFCLQRCQGVVRLSLVVWFSRFLNIVWYLVKLWMLVCLFLDRLCFGRLQVSIEKFMFSVQLIMC